MKLPYELATPLLETYLKKHKTLMRKYIGTPVFIAVLFTIADRWKQPMCPTTDEYVMWLSTAISLESTENLVDLFFSHPSSGIDIVMC